MRNDLRNEIQAKARESTKRLIFNSLTTFSSSLSLRHSFDANGQVVAHI
jgi:hypothetical protein